MVREDAPGEKRLVAYVVAAAGAAPGATELRAHARAHVPDYMVPEAIVVLERLPLTANGKLDRRALPAPDAARPDLTRAFVAPRDEVERWVAELWQAALGVERVGVEDNFFELGGHSLKAAIVANQLQAQLGEIFYVLAIFERPTVAELAAYLRQRYARALAARLGIDAEPADGGRRERITREQVTNLRQLVRRREPAPEPRPGVASSLASAAGTGTSRAADPAASEAPESSEGTVRSRVERDQ
jgi:hypothetical protein